MSLSLIFGATAHAQQSADAAQAGSEEAAAGEKTIEPEKWNAKFQATYVWQRKPSFFAPYTGAMSLKPERERSYSFTTTASFGYRPWAGGEVYLDLEGAQGVPLSGLTGLGGFTNGELAKTSGARLKLYRARAFLRQTWNHGGEQEAVESDARQLAGMEDKRRTVLTVGNLAVIDIFDNNRYNHDPRTQFMNWSLMTQGAFDYAADARGYSWGAVLEWFHDDWELRFGRFLQPQEPNGQPLDYRIFKHYGDQLEVAHAHTLAGQHGKLRALVFRNHAVMTSYSDALAQAAQRGGVPDLNTARYGAKSKRGFGLNLEQALSDDVGLFARASWADGKTEIYAFTEIDRSLSAGLLVRGRKWGRANDTLGLGVVRNFLSASHRQYLAEGGMGPFIGDGRLNYRPEDILEMFYSVGIGKKSSVTFDWQHIRNPAYNADRGPVNALAVRLHTEF
ncbi:MAG: carbohydrate porin [Comamonas sp.]|uniref:carbohydrate porin n=1 Tax=Comamonas sp. TaxID=34028 RepID=UPI002820E7CD|nr:carbohydrate porin [Comamonas sp.]MDR0216354.1 carbohydrate porin [Comamonas sp.]